MFSAMEGVAQGLQPLSDTTVEEGKVKQPCLQEEGEPQDVRCSGEEEDEGEALGGEGVQKVGCGVQTNVKHLKVKGQR